MAIHLVESPVMPNLNHCTCLAGWNSERNQAQPVGGGGGGGQLEVAIWCVYPNAI